MPTMVTGPDGKPMAVPPMPYYPMMPGMRPPMPFPHMPMPQPTPVSGQMPAQQPPPLPAPWPYPAYPPYPPYPYLPRMPMPGMPMPPPYKYPMMPFPPYGYPPGVPLPLGATPASGPASGASKPGQPAGGEQAAAGDSSKTPTALSSNAPSPPLQPGSGPLSPGEPPAAQSQSVSTELQQPSPPQYGSNPSASQQPAAGGARGWPVPQVSAASHTGSGVAEQTSSSRPSAPLAKPNPDVLSFVNSMPANMKQRMSQGLTAMSLHDIVPLINSLSAMRAFNWVATLLPDRWFQNFLQDAKFLANLYDSLIAVSNRPVVIENPVHFDTSPVDETAKQRATELIRQVLGPMGMFAERQLDTEPIFRSETAMRQLHWFLSLLPDGWPEELRREPEFLAHVHAEMLVRAKAAPTNPSASPNPSQQQSAPSPAASSLPPSKPASLAVTMATANQNPAQGQQTSGGIPPASGGDATSPSGAQREEFQNALDEFKQFISESLARNLPLTAFLQENAALFRNNLEALTRISSRRPDVVCCYMLLPVRV